MAIFVAVVTSVLAGFLNAISGVFQRKAIGSPQAAKLYSKTQLVKTSKNRLWQIGAATEGVAAILELAALYFGSLLVVEPLLMTNLVFLLAIIHFRYKNPISAREWIGILAISIGITVMLITAHPHGGHANYGPSWVLPTITIGFLILIGALITRRLKNARQRGAIGALTGGLSLGLSAAFTRLTMVQLHSGLIPTLTHWPVYALTISAIISVFTVQMGYGSGPLKITQPVLEIVAPFIGVLLGLIMFGDSIDTSALAVSIELLGVAATLLGVLILGISKRDIKFEVSPTLAAS